MEIEIKIKFKPVFSDDGTINMDATRAICQAKFDQKYDKLTSKGTKKNGLSGSQIAKSGVDSENNLVNQFSNWKTSPSTIALEIVRQLCNMCNMDFSQIVDVKAYLWKACPLISDDEKKRKHKTDVFIVVQLVNEKDHRVFSISQKRTTTGFNQVDRRWVVGRPHPKNASQAQGYQKILYIPDDVARLLKFFTGEAAPSEYLSAPPTLKDGRRLFIDEMTVDDRKLILSWLDNNILPLLQFVFVGRRTVYPPEYMLIENASESDVEYAILKISDVIELYRGNGKATLSPEGSIYLGSAERIKSVFLQRKGGDNGADTANQLQVKFNPLWVFYHWKNKSKTT